MAQKHTELGEYCQASLAFCILRGGLNCKECDYPGKAEAFKLKNRSENSGIKQEGRNGERAER